MMSPRISYDIRVIWELWEVVEACLACVAASRGPRRANVFLQEATFSLERDNVTLKGHDILIIFLIRVSL
jgi:hypothetical protein